MQISATPVSRRERIFTLDAVRGIALLGIFIMNMPWFNTSFFADLGDLWPQTWDKWTHVGTEVLFSGKFNSMFSMLFAIGFLLQLERIEARDPGHAKTVYLRRIFWLFVFGAIHCCVFWTGDVLHMYALFGVLLLALLRVPEKVLWTLFGLCLLTPVALGIWSFMTFSPAHREYVEAAEKLWEATNNAAYGHGSFLAAAREHFDETVFLYSDAINLKLVISFYTQIFMTMLLGLMLGRRHFFQNAAQYLPLVKRVQWWALAAGLAAGAVNGAYLWTATSADQHTPTVFRLVAVVCYWLSRVLVMVFYVSTIVRMAHSTRWQSKLVPFATAGRMPLTNYLLQTMIGTTLFYGWGFGLWGKVGPAIDLLLALGIYFLVQIPLSRWWLARFELGPMEYLWRRLTYGRAGVSHAALVAAPAPARNP
jgi:uncharacterized protein